MQPDRNLELQNIIAETHQMGLTMNLSRQKKESVNVKVEQFKF